MEHEFQFRIFRTEKGLPFQIFRCMFPEIFRWKDPKKYCSIYCLTGFSGNIFVIGTSVSVCLQTNFKSIFFVWRGGGGGWGKGEEHKVNIRTAKVRVTSLIAFLCFREIWNKCLLWIVSPTPTPTPTPTNLIQFVALLVKYLQMPGRSDNLIWLKHLLKADVLFFSCDYFYYYERKDFWREIRIIGLSPSHE